MIPSRYVPVGQLEHKIDLGVVLERPHCANGSQGLLLVHEPKRDKDLKDVYCLSMCPFLYHKACG